MGLSSGRNIDAYLRALLITVTILSAILSFSTAVDVVAKRYKLVILKDEYGLPGEPGFPHYWEARYDTWFHRVEVKEDPREGHWGGAPSSWIKEIKPY